MSEALAVIQQPQAAQPLALTSFEDYQKMGELFAKSKMFSDVTDAAQAFVKMLAGAEFGLPPMVAMTGIYIVKGKIQLGADLLAKKIKSSGRYDYRVKTLTDTACAIEFFEHKELIGTSDFTIEQARKAGTQNLDKFPRNMLFARALSNGVRWYCPDVTTMPAYVEGELVDGEPQAEPETDHTKAVGYEDRPAVIAAIKTAAKECGITLPKELIAEAKNAGVTIAGNNLQIALESLTTEQRQTLLTHLQTKAVDLLEAASKAADHATEPAPDVHEGEVV